MCYYVCKLFIFFKYEKMQKIPKNSKILKNDCHFWILHPQISLKLLSNICKNVVFFLCKGGGKMIKDFRKTIKFKKN